jgi:hypothetical protein
VESGLLGSALVILWTCVRRGAGVSGDIDVGGLGSASVGWGLGMVLWDVERRACAAKNGFQALHYNMLSRFEFGDCMGVLRVFRRGWVVRVAIGGCMLGLG